METLWVVESYYFHLITFSGILYLNSHYDHGINDTFHTSPLNPHFSPVTQDLSLFVTYLPLVHFSYLLSNWPS